jgi:peptidoglycan/xylan/chitin deacetylase (PgdA/CDA1 family)
METALAKYILRFTRQAKYSFENIAYLMGLNHSFFRKARGSRILVYHGICLRDHLRFNTIFLTQKVFESHLRFYKKYFNLISLDDYYLGKFDERKFNICLSFDDGFANNYKYVLPLLEKYQVPAAFFITAIRDAGYDVLWNDCLSLAYKYGPRRFLLKKEEFIKGKDGKYKSLNGQYLADILRQADFEEKAEMIGLLKSFREKAIEDYWLQMTEEQIKELSRSRWVTIGSHGYYHNDLAKISGNAVKHEIARSKQFLENITGKKIKALAFPYGSYTKEVIEAAKEIDFTQLLATEFLFPGDIADTTLRERLTINPFISVINQMHANITGKY